MANSTIAYTTDRHYVPALAPVYTRAETLAYPVMRFVTGAFLVPHGLQKIFGLWGGNINATAGFFSKIGIEPALPLAYLVGGTEIIAGTLIAIGLFTRPAALAAAVLLFVATFKVHLENGFFWTTGGFEYPLMWELYNLMIALAGGGRLSVDRTLRREF